MKKFIFFISLALILGCSTTFQSSQSSVGNFVVEVDAYGSESKIDDKSYYLLPVDSTINTSDFRYIEFSEILEKALTEKGYTRVQSISEAKLLIVINYGMSDAKTYERNLIVPTWGVTGISNVNTSGNISVYSNNINYSQNTTSTPSYGITGSRVVNQQYDMYMRYFGIAVFDYEYYRKTNKEKAYWKAVLSSAGSSNDLRRVFPVMIAAGMDYFGSSSRERKIIRIKENDKRVRKLKESE